VLLFRTALLVVAAACVFAAEEKQFRLEGEIVPAASVQLTLHGSTTPFHEIALSDARGRFRFSRLLAGAYTLIFFIPGSGEFRQTVQVGPGTATPKGVVRVHLDIGSLTPVEGDTGSRFTASVSQLKIPDKATGEYRKAQQCLSRRDVAGAREHLLKAVEIAPQFVDAWNTLGTMAYQTRDFSEAEKYFREALKQDPQSYSPLVNLGGTLLTMQRDMEALDYNVRSVLARPEDPLANSQLGMNYAALGRLAQAVRYLKKAVELDPAHFSCPQLYLAQVYRQMGDPAAAADQLEGFLKYHPDWEQADALRESIRRLRSEAAAP